MEKEREMRDKGEKEKERLLSEWEKERETNINGRYEHGAFEQEPSDFALPSHFASLAHPTMAHITLLTLTKYTSCRLSETL